MSISEPHDVFPVYSHKPTQLPEPHTLSLILYTDGVKIGQLYSRLAQNDAERCI